MRGRRSVGRWAPFRGPRPVLQWVAEASDPRLALYRHKDRRCCAPRGLQGLGARNQADFDRQARQAAERVLGGPAAGPSWRHWPCQVKVHYSWDCLRRLLAARQAGREVQVVSVLLSSDVEEEQKSLAAACCEQVYVADTRSKGPGCLPSHVS